MTAIALLDDLDRAALEAVLTTGQSTAAAVALELALAEALTVMAERCGCPGQPGLCTSCAALTERALLHRLRAWAVSR